MNSKTNWKKWLFITGIILLIAGALDPLEGSTLIVVGSGLSAIATYLMKDRHWKLFLSAFIMIFLGVIFLFYFSSLGGFGGSSSLSVWWALLILSYPLGWLMELILLVIRMLKGTTKQAI